MKGKRNIALLFGGRSAEHEISVMSARNVYDALNKDKYNVILVGIDRQGEWTLQSRESLFSHHFVSSEKHEKLLVQPGLGIACLDKKNLCISQIAVDVVFPILHGTNGEDGTMQGLLKLIDVPFVGANHISSAISMDKDITKRLWREAGLPQSDFLVIKKQQIEDMNYEEICQQLGNDLFIKPANCGSSVGVSRVTNSREFKQAIKLAFAYDCKIIVERTIQGREVECSVLGNDQPKASLPGEIVVHHEYYSYAAKYLEESGASLRIPAELSEEQINGIRDLAVKAYTVLDCQGMARVDFFIDYENNILLNEINTIPGFTRISMYPKMWEVTGIGYSELLDKLIELSILRYKDERELNYNI